MKQVLNIAGASIREHSRRKLILVFVAITLIITVLQIVFLLQSETARSLGGAFSAFVSAGVFARLAYVAALAVSMGNIGRPFSDGEASLVLARPVARWQYVLGRLAASAGLVAALCLIMAVETQAVRLFDGRQMSAAMWRYWGIQTYNLTVLSALTTLVSAFTASPVVAAVIAFAVDRFAAAIDVLVRLSEVGRLEGGLASGLRIAWWITPKNLKMPLASVAGDLAGEGSVPPGLLPWMENSAGLVAWSLSYLVLMVLVTIIGVRRKEVRG